MLKKITITLSLCALLSACTDPFDYLHSINEKNFEQITFQQTLAESQRLFGAAGEALPSKGVYQLHAWQENYKLIVISYADGLAMHKTYSEAVDDKLSTVEILWDFSGNATYTYSL